MSRYKLVVQYDGSEFSGWQLQNKSRTVQGVLENAVQKITNSTDRIPVHGSGRTDAGVHAWAQVAHTDMKLKLDEGGIKRALNGNLPQDCRIVGVEHTHNDFHARYDAKSRYYRYQCYIGHSILYRNQSWTISGLNIDFLNTLAKKLMGEHEFLSFCKFRHDLKNTKCTIYHSEWKSDQEMLTFFIGGNRFLHHMIRYLVGTMIAVNETQFSKKEFLSLLEIPRKDVQVFKAPAQGLILEKINYA